jgi:hypothetical protein
VDEIIHIKLLEEGSLAYRPVRAIKLNGTLFKITEKPSDDEFWEFQFDDIMYCLPTRLSDGVYLVAVEKSKQDLKYNLSSA